jgi:hypothetical protein
MSCCVLNILALFLLTLFQGHLVNLGYGLDGFQQLLIGVFIGQKLSSPAVRAQFAENVLTHSQTNNFIIQLLRQVHQKCVAFPGGESACNKTLCTIQASYDSYGLAST